jgi:CubicO group peptidase (beta-lactamase class C family)
MQTSKPIVVIHVILFVLLSIFLTSQSYAKVFPGKNWKTGTPASQNVNPTALNKAMTYLDDNSRGIGADEAMVIRNGYVIWKGSKTGAYHTIYSGTKVFTTTVLGLLIEDGDIASLEQPATDIQPDLDSRYSKYGNIKIRHLANFTSGYNADTSAANGMKWGDPRLFLDPQRSQSTAGTTFRYHDPAIHQLGDILTLASNSKLETIFKTRVANKIGMRKWSWKHCGYSDNGKGSRIVARFQNPSGIYGGGIWTTPSDLGRFGLLYLNEGKWKNRRIIEAGWVDKATKNQVPTSLKASGYDGRGQFGFMWRTNGGSKSGSRRWPAAPPQTYTLHGMSRNFCFIVPEWDMVIVRMSPPKLDGMPSSGTKVWNKFFSILKPGIQ